MRRSTEGEALHKDLIAGLHATAYQRQVHSSRTSTQANDFAVKSLRAIALTIGKSLQIFLKRIHIRTHRHHPIGIKCLLHILLFQTSLTHVSQTGECVESFYTEICILLILLLLECNMQNTKILKIDLKSQKHCTKCSRFRVFSLPLHSD